MAIHFFSEEITFAIKHKSIIKTWLKQLVLAYEGKKLGSLNYIFCSDEYLLTLNQEHLQHDYYTDIITFDNSEDEDIISGDLFISVDRVIDNAATLQVAFEKEFYRVLVHGLLHLLGFGDKTPEEVEIMRSKEDEAIKALESLLAIKK